MTSDQHTTRWRTSAGQHLAKEVWRRLLAKETLDGLSLGCHDGRIDLRGISAPEVTKEDLPPFHNWTLEKLKGQLQLRNVQLENIDFANSRLGHLQFFNSRIVGCRFDHADCKDWGVRATDVKHTRFVGANLRNAVLGPWYQGRGSIYEFVDFSHADMRGLISTTATYLDCNFSYAKLNKIDFQSSSFIRCRFAGEVREVLFYDNAFDTRKQEPNPMEDVDFSKAKLRWVDFRRLNLDRVKLPEDQDHLIVKHYRCILERALAAVKDDETRAGRGLRALLENDLKWIGSRRDVGVFNCLDFRDAWGEEGEEFAIRLLRRAERECTKTHTN